MIKSKKQTIGFYYHLIEKLKIKNNEKIFEQSYIQEELKVYNEKITIKEISLNIFPSGCEYFLKRGNLFYDEIECIYFYSTCR